jgi:hypothetical protein
MMTPILEEQKDGIKARREKEKKRGAYITGIDEKPLLPEGEKRAVTSKQLRFRVDLLPRRAFLPPRPGQSRKMSRGSWRGV